jgi:hypothetical protein
MESQIKLKPSRYSAYCKAVPMRHSTADSRFAVQSCRTGTLSEIRYATCTNRYRQIKYQDGEKRI